MVLANPTNEENTRQCIACLLQYIEYHTSNEENARWCIVCLLQHIEYHTSNEECACYSTLNSILEDITHHNTMDMPSHMSPHLTPK